MLCCVIDGPSYSDIEAQICQVYENADLVELRFDLFESIDIRKIEFLRKKFPIPMLFTFRRKSAEANFFHTEELDIKILLQLAKLLPEYIDIEAGTSNHVIESIFAAAPTSKIIISHHDFEKTPFDLDVLYKQMQHPLAWGYKIAVYAKSSLDALKLMLWRKKNPGNITAIAMGETGSFTRILAPIFQCFFTYTYIKNYSRKVAAGQLCFEDLIQIYRYKDLSIKTCIYALIGDPVEQSIGHYVHNECFRLLKANAIYVKIIVKKHEIEEFVLLSKNFPFKGFSITMPLKEAILPYVDEMDCASLEIGAINTLSLESGKWFGANTDGKGALAAIEKKMDVKDKKIILLGCGGSAKAIAYECLQKGAKVTFAARDKRKGQEIANHFKASFVVFDSIKEKFDLIVNCTPLKDPIDLNLLPSKAIVMDSNTNPKESFFLQQAKKKGWPVIFGCEMFVEQAALQRLIWFKEKALYSESRLLMAQKAEDALAK